MSRPLRIFLCCQQSLVRHAVPAYAFWAEYFRGAFMEAGHKCIEAPECDWAAGLLPDAQRPTDWAERTWNTAVNFIRREHARQPIDIFLAYLFPNQVKADAVAEIRALGIPTVNFFCDNVREFRRVPTSFRGFDLHWVPEYKALPLYREANLPFLHAPMACWIDSRWRTPVEQETLPPTFVGTRDTVRERLFAEAINSGLQVDLRGTGWLQPATASAPVPSRARNPLQLAARQIDFVRQYGLGAWSRKFAPASAHDTGNEFDFTPWTKPAPVGDDYWNTLRNCTVSIGVNRYPSLRHPSNHPDTYSRLRDIEAPMAGACYLTEWTEGLNTLYDLGTEIETYRSPVELAEKTRELSRDQTKRNRLRHAGQRRALAEHTIARTIERIVEKLGHSS